MTCIYSKKLKCYKMIVMNWTIKYLFPYHYEKSFIMLLIVFFFFFKKQPFGAFLVDVATVRFMHCFSKGFTCYPPATPLKAYDKSRGIDAPWKWQTGYDVILKHKVCGKKKSTKHSSAKTVCVCVCSYKQKTTVPSIFFHTVPLLCVWTLQYL